MGSGLSQVTDTAGLSHRDTGGTPNNLRDYLNGLSGTTTNVESDSTDTLTSADLGLRHNSLIVTDITLTLPALSGLASFDGRSIEFQNDPTSTANVLIDCDGTDYILLNGYENGRLTLAPGDALHLRVDIASDRDVTLDDRWIVTFDGMRGPYCKLKRETTNQTIIDGAPDLCEFDEVVSDPYLIADTTTNYRITPDMLAEYDLSGTIAFLSDAGAIETRMMIYKNGSLHKFFKSFYFDGNCLETFNIPVEVTATTDYFDVRILVFVAAGGTGHEFGVVTDAGQDHISYLELRRRK